MKAGSRRTLVELAHALIELLPFNLGANHTVSGVQREKERRRPGVGLFQADRKHRRRQGHALPGPDARHTALAGHQEN